MMENDGVAAQWCICPLAPFNLAAAVWRIVRLRPNELTADHVGRLVALVAGS
jgi:hypothetical protein